MPRLWRALSKRRKAQFYILLLLMVAASLAEVFSLGMIVPFLGALTAPQQTFANPLVQGVTGSLPFVSAENLVGWLAVAFCAATLVAAAVRLLLLYASTGFSFALGADLSLEIYRRTLYQPFSVHLSRNSSEVISGVVGKTHVMINNVIGQLLTISSSTIIMVGILIALFSVSPIVTSAAVTGFVVIYGGILVWTRRSLARDSAIVAVESTLVVKALQEGLGGIRDVLVDSTQETFAGIYQSADRKMRAAQGRMNLLQASPRFLVEGLGMILIALLAVALSESGQRADVVPVLGALALGAQRLLPLAQQAYSSITTIRGSASSLDDVLELLEQPLPQTDFAKAAKMPFEHTLRLDGIRFSYSGDGPAILQKIELTIPKGARVGVFGATGGGKSTLLDIAMGLLDPTAGAILVDGERITGANRRNWQAHVAHVPQSIYLSDSSIAENIAFGQKPADIDMARVEQSARLAQIDEVIRSWPAKYATTVGERGVRLSGGQRQRIGIARALYKEADVIIFDEATSALDNQTERELMDSIDGLSSTLTIIMVAHRLTTLQKCDFVIELEAGRIKRVGTYGELVDR